MRHSGALALAAVSVLLAPPPGGVLAQTQLDLEIGGSRILPPTGVDGDAASFLVGGLRALDYDPAGNGWFASFLAGRSLDEALGGDFLSAELGGEAWRPIAGAWFAGLQARAFGFEVSSPYPYRAAAAEGAAAVRYRGGTVSGTLSATGGFGRSRVTLRRQMGGASRDVDDDLWRYGGTLEVLVGGGTLAAGAAAGIHESAGGTYRSLGARVLVSGAGPAVELRLDTWDAPLGRETTGGLAFILPVGGWSLRGVAGRPGPDPLTLAEPGQGSGGVLVGRRLWGEPAGPRKLASLHEVESTSAAGARVRFLLEAPPGATQVQILGDFTLWEPSDMSRQGEHWVVSIDVIPGTHHFGFLVDGEWFVPEDAPDAVPDEWGRRNATLVIEEGSGLS